jgi:GMP synthase (glutamine-hydrolysing)
VVDSRQKLNILLLQIRYDQEVRVEEHESFANYGNLDINQIDILNVFDTPAFKVDVVKDYDAVFVGGASEANVLQPEKYPFIQDSINLIKYCAQQKIPTFASCFGFQLAVLAFGGTVLDKDRDYELGTVKITLTSSAGSDPVFEGIDNEFFAVSVHRQYSSDVPDCLEVLAYTDQCIHSFKHKEAPLWAFQFHPEVDRETLVKRLTIFSNKYNENKDQLKKVLDSAVETPESNYLVQNFVNNVLQKNKP